MGEALKAWSFLSVWSAGFVAALTVRYVGEPLAMAAQMWVAMNTEPARPHSDFPILATALLAVLPAPLVARKRWRWALVAALPFFALPWWHFFCLYAEAGRASS